jgi:hypothetical protein
MNGTWTRRWAAVAAALATLVTLAACGSDESSEPERTGASRGAEVGEHWHAAFGLQRCGRLLPPLADAVPDESGLHSHQDGLIHIHPFTERYAGDGANLGAFFATVGLEVDGTSSITLPSGEKLEPRAGCAGDPAEIRLVVDNEAVPGDPNDYVPLDGEIIHLVFDTPSAPTLPLPWASAVTNPGDVR